MPFRVSLLHDRACSPDCGRDMMVRKSAWLVSAGWSHRLLQLMRRTTTPARSRRSRRRPSRRRSRRSAGGRGRSRSDEIIITAQGRTPGSAGRADRGHRGRRRSRCENSGATDIRQLNQLAPSLLVSSTGTEANGSARIRGIGTVGDNPGLKARSRCSSTASIARARASASPNSARSTASKCCAARRARCSAATRPPA